MGNQTETKNEDALKSHIVYWLMVDAICLYYGYEYECECKCNVYSFIICTIPLPVKRVGECDCRQDACAALRLAAIVRDTIRSTCGSYRLSDMIS